MMFQRGDALFELLPDGDHTLNFIAYSERYDTLTAAQTDGGPLSFTVDTLVISNVAVLPSFTSI